MKDYLTNVLNCKVDVDAENCNINYTIPNSDLWVQHHTDVNEYILYDKNSNQEAILTSINQLSSFLTNPNN